MSIAYSVDLGKRKIQNFQELVSAVFREMIEIGGLIIRDMLEARDLELMHGRDRERYRCKGIQKTSLKTQLGVIPFSRRVYLDNQAGDGPKYIHLLDEDMQIEKIGLISKDVCQMAAELVCEMSYCEAAKVLSEACSIDISAMGVWNVVQAMGKMARQRVDHYSVLAEQQAGCGNIISKVLYEENDGVWIKLQGKDRKEYGESKEMKVGIAYDGATHVMGKDGVARRSLHNKVVYASFETVKMFSMHKKGVIANFFNVQKIEVLILNGDGAQWIQKFDWSIEGVELICVLDEYHRNKKISRCVKNSDLAKELLDLLYQKKIPELFQRIEEALAQAEDGEEKEGLQELLKYYTENRDALLSPCDRGIEIPETNQPGVVHHARLGSMESNVFTVIGNRMKGRRACWSIRGAENLALLLCWYHSIKAGDLFQKIPPLPVDSADPESDEIHSSCSAADIPETIGKGPKCWCRATLPNISWLRNMTGYRSVIDLRY